MSNRPLLQGPDLAGALLQPSSVALLGVSNDPLKTTGRPLQYLRQAGFSSKIYCVNPRRRTVQGEHSYTSLDELPEVPDNVFILTDTTLAMEAVAECGRIGVPLATILAAGFSESGTQGAARETELLRCAQEQGVRLLGPSSLGVVNIARGLRLTANAAFAEPNLITGNILCASHSGSLIGALASRGLSHGIGFHSFISVGSEVDLSIGEICTATLDDTDITGYLLFLESMRHAEKLRAFALEAAKRHKPVAAYKLGRSSVGAELSVSHTGALAGEDDVADILLKESGIARLDTFEGLLEVLPLLHRVPLVNTAQPGKVGVVTTTGGGAAMAVDQMGIRGVSVTRPSDNIFKRLRTSGIDVVPGRIIDLTLAGTRHEVMKRTLEIMFEASEFDIVLVTVGTSARMHPELTVEAVIESGGTNKPLACFIVPEAPDALKRLGSAGIPTFRTPESCGDVIAATLHRSLRVTQNSAFTRKLEGRLLDEAQSYELLARVGISHVPLAILNGDVTDEPVLPFSYPVVVKVLSSHVHHKTDVGGVVLNVEDRDGLKAAIERIKNNLHQHFPNLAVQHMLVQPVIKGLGEMLVGYRRDPDVGPLVMLATGGVNAEIYCDRALRLAPVDRAIARDMIGEVKATAMLAGYRGQTAGDIEALEEVIVALSRLAELSDVTVLEAEINPLIILKRGDGATAVDALIRVAAN